MTYQDIKEALASLRKPEPVPPVHLKLTEMNGIKVDSPVDDFYTWRLALYWMRHGFAQDGINVVNNAWCWMAMSKEEDWV